MNDFTINVIKEESDKAITKGNAFPGYFGHSPRDFSEEELRMLLNILYDKYKTAESEVYKYSKILNY